MIESSTPQIKEVPSSNEIGVFDELDPLRRVALWGEPGPETALAKLLPHKFSLFYDDMDVMEARTEMTIYTGLLEDNGVEVQHVRDFIASTVPIPDISLDQVREKLVERGREILKTYPVEEYPEQKGKDEGFEEEIEALFQEDVTKYGEDKAKALALALSLNGKLPMGNAIYARDQMNVLLSTQVVSSMKEGIRQPEVPYFREFYRSVGITNTSELPKDPSFTFEGGDAYIVDGVIYIGVAYRTSEDAAVKIYKDLQRELKEKGFKFAIVVNGEVLNLTHDERQKIMHIDTWSFFFGDKQVLLLEEEAKKRTVIFFDEGQNGEVIKREVENYYDYLQKQGYTIHKVPDREQKDFACNNIALDRKRVTGPLQTNVDTIKLLEEAGQEVIKAPLKEITRGYGAAHCITGTLLRSK